MKINNLYLAEVVSNNDINNNISFGQEGRVQIYVESIMKGWSRSHLPWARPFFSGGSKDHGCVNIPEIGDKIWTFCEKDDLKINWYYISGVSLKNINPIKKFIQFLYNKLKLSAPLGLGLSSEYPDIKFHYYKNGIVIGVSSSNSNPEIFIYHPKGTFIVIDSDGDIVTKGDWKHYGKLEVTNEVTAMCDTLAVKLSEHKHISSVPGGNTSPPT